MNRRFCGAIVRLDTNGEEILLLNEWTLPTPPASHPPPENVGSLITNNEDEPAVKFVQILCNLR
jgi:hypothetical protein